jgi:hypothetical protein
MKFFSILLVLCGLTATVSGQRVVPLGEYPIATRAVEPQGLVDCGNPDLTGIDLVVLGQDRTVRIDLDTAGLGSDLNDYRCIGCDELRFGSVTLRSDTVIYRPNVAVEQGLDTIGLTVCSPGGVCADTVSRVFLVRRPGRTIELGIQSLGPGELAEVVVPDDALPGGTVCRTLSRCSADYAGRGQRLFFNEGFGQSNDFSYRAARYGGTDSVCVTLCNEFGLCDTYRAGFTIERPTVELPFFDDFSYGGVRPAIGLWQDADVLVNDSYGDRPPSIGVATFDGLDQDGRPYPVTGAASRPPQPRDYLTSVPIDLAGRAGSVLSFYLQPRGLGNRPELRDSFLVQFLGTDGQWRTAFGEGGLSIAIGNSEFIPFAGYTVPVPPAFQYDGFQFRFVNLSSERGGVDNWNLDYVKLSNQSTTLITQDLALTAPPFRLLAPYTSMPLRQLQAAGQAALRDSIFLPMRNHRADVTPVTSSTYTVAEAEGDFSVTGGLFPSAFFGQDNGIAPRSFDRRMAVLTQLPDYEAIRAYLFGLNPERNVTLNTRYDLTVATEDLFFAPGIGENSSATRQTVFADYLAYDDGSAEAAIEGQGGNVTVQRYPLFAADELTGIRIRLPRGLTAPGEQMLNLVVYAADEAGQPGELLYEQAEPVLYAESFYNDSLQAFTSYALDAPLPLPVGDYFVGWRQTANRPSLAIGFDRNNQPEGVQFYDAGAGWQELRGSTRGAIMIRPLLAGADIRPTSTDNEITDDGLDVFPNPTSHYCTLRPRPKLSFTFRLLDVTGREILRGEGARTLDLSVYPPGLYLLDYRLDGEPGQRKIIRN